MRENNQLLEVFDRIRAALFSNNVAALAMLIADDYVGFDPNGNAQYKEATLDSYQPGGARIDKYNIEEVVTRVIGEVGIISGNGYIHGTFRGSPFEHSLRFLDLYVYRKGGWQLYMSQVTPRRAV